MKCEEIICNRFIKPLKGKKTGTVGTELEFPLLNLEKKPIDPETALGLLTHFLWHGGFEVSGPDAKGRPAFITNAYGDCISFDNSYNNIEFSMNFCGNLCEIKNRFYSYLTQAQEYLAPKGYIITGMGTNPYKKFITQSHVDYPVYNMVDEYLHKFDCEKTHAFPDFPAYLSSVQTHLDVNESELPKAATLFARIDFLRCILFANSPDFDFNGVLCYRDFLWHKSAFGLCAKNTGPVDEKYETISDIQKSFYRRSMFNCIRDGKYVSFKPVLLEDYFEVNPESDIEQFLSFRHIETTCRGTLEIRSDCSQPLSEAMIPPAFNLGILVNLDKAVSITEAFFDGRNIKNSYLRNLAANGIEITEFTKDRLKKYALDMSETAFDGLKSRNLGEEKLLEPIFGRAESLRCPTKYTLENKDRIDEVIKKYSEI